MSVFYIVGAIVITFLINFLLYVLYRFDEKKTQEKRMIKNAVLILNKLDRRKKPIGGNKMMEINLKNVAKLLVKEIRASEERIMEEIENRFSELEENIGDDEESTEEELDSLFDEEVEDSVEEVEEIMPKSLDITKRQVPSELPKEEIEEKKEDKKEHKTEKKGLFAIGEKLGLGGKK